MKLTKIDKEMLKEQYKKVWHDREDMVDFCTKRVSGYIEFDGIIITFDKPHIETRFCFGEHGYDYDEVNDYCHRMSKSEEYFKAHNMRQIRDRIKNTVCGDYRVTPYLCKSEYSGQDDDCRLGYIEYAWHGDPPRNKSARPLTDEEREQYAAFLEEEANKFEKRLNTYLKRYGLSKCHYWTYWADR